MNGRVTVGVALLLLGVGFGVTGYERAQPTTGEKVLAFAANFAGQQVPAALQRDKTDAYILMAAGAALFAAGVGVLARQQRGT